jgi:hypothetical protein
MAGESTCHGEDCFGMPAINERLGLFQPTSAGPAPTQGLNSLTLPGDNIPPMKLYGYHCAGAIWDIKHASKSSRSLMDALIKTRHTQATEPHDKVYGILGIFENDIVPDYLMKVTELWWGISLKILRTEIADSLQLSSGCCSMEPNPFTRSSSSVASIMGWMRLVTCRRGPLTGRSRESPPV